MEYIALTVDDLPKIASQFLDTFKNKKTVAFEAEMGAGKTTFILEILKKMGIESPNGSPTYSIVNSYESPLYGKIYHFDLYRIKNIEEVYDIGIEEMLYNDAYCFIEWPDTIEDILPEDTLRVKIRLGDKQERIIEVR